MPKKIATHSSPFHCDELLALAMLRQLPEYVDATLIRTRLTQQLEKCDVIFDVGDEYDPSRHRYDHHQASFNMTIQDFYPSVGPAIKLSSAGLIYAHFGKRVIKEILKEKSTDSEMIDVLFGYIYSTFVSEIDANDNGIAISSKPPNYFTSTTLPRRVSRLNVPWNSKKVDENECFNRAYELVKNEFLEYVQYTATVWYPARAPTMKMIRERFSFHPSGMILFLDKFCSWKDHFFLLEKELVEIDERKEENGDFTGRPVFVIWEKKSRVCPPSYFIQSIPHREGMPFTSRVILPAEWAGKRKDELSGLVGVEGARFVHVNGFIGGHKTKVGALRMATLALEKANYL